MKNQAMVNLFQKQSPKIMIHNQGQSKTIDLNISFFDHETQDQTLCFASDNIVQEFLNYSLKFFENDQLSRSDQESLFFFYFIIFQASGYAEEDLTQEHIEVLKKHIMDLLPNLNEMIHLSLEVLIEDMQTNPVDYEGDDEFNLIGLDMISKIDEHLDALGTQEEHVHMKKPSLSNYYPSSNTQKNFEEFLYESIDNDTYEYYLFILCFFWMRFYAKRTLSPQKFKNFSKYSSEIVLCLMDVLNEALKKESEE